MNPLFIKICLCNWSLDLPGYHIWAHPIMDFFISIALTTVNCVRADTVKGFGRNWFTFPITCSVKYPFAWFCNYSSWFYSNILEIFFVPVPVFTMNARRPQPYLLAKLRKWLMISLAFETEIFSLSVYLSISLFYWR